MSENSDAEKEHEPSQKKLEDARKRGEVVKSPELSVAAAYAGLLLAAAGIGAPALLAAGSALETMIDRAEVVAPIIIGGGPALATGIVGASLVPLLPFFLGPAVAVLAVLFAQRAIVFAPEKLSPKLSRINPVANAKQKFGRGGLFEFAKSSAKLAIVSALLSIFLWRNMHRALTSQAQPPSAISAEAMTVIVEFLFLVLLISGSIAALDYLWQRSEFLRRNRMTRQEMLDELKQSEGDPHLRAQRRQRGEAIALNRMMADVPKADVVIVNPTHYAVALRWDRSSGRAPLCVAKGTDIVAGQIREAAAAAGVPIRSDPPTARAIFASVDIGAEIRPEHYAPVAAAIRFAEAMRLKARRRYDK
ncbi:MAG: flagellar biosynthesis protein FlhB [Rhodobacteraceae bacterium]|nr:flagellar biosynthesis protein FlhB [Paracoccaceae bacterium]